MSLNKYTVPSLVQGNFTRLHVSNTALDNVTPQTLTVAQVLGGLVTYAVVGAPSVLNLPTPAQLIQDLLTNGIDVGDGLPLTIRNRGANPVTLTPTGIAVMDPAGGGAVAATTVRSYWIRIDNVGPGTEDYTVFDVTDSGAFI